MAHRPSLVAIARQLIVFVSLHGITALASAIPASAGPYDTVERPVSLSLSFTGFNFLNDDMSATYGTVPAVGVRLVRQMDERAEFFVGIQYAADSGNPYRGTPDFRTGKKTELKLTPVDFGVRLNAMNHPRHRFYLGFALRYLWMSEEGPWASSWYDLLEPEYSGWGWGLRFLGGPEWRDSSGRIAVGLEGSFGPQEAAVEQQDDERDADLSGTEVRIYVSGLF